jgi:hypothetical protein
MTPSHKNNEGIIQIGGTFNVDSLAVGKNARVIKTFESASKELDDSGLHEVAACLQALVDVLYLHAAELEDFDRLLNESTIVAKELSENVPNKSKITARLKEMAGIAQSVSSVVNAIRSLAGAVAMSL